MPKWKDRIIKDDFFAVRQGEFLTRMLSHQWDALNDFYGEGDSHAIRNLKIAAGVLPKCDIPYGDFAKESDLSKWLEAAAYTVALRRDADLEAKIDSVAELFSKAQAEDGYLGTYYLATDPKLRFTSVSEMHELYCAGHLAEAAVTYYEATGRTALLDTVRKYLDMIIDTFGDGEGRIDATPGHEELELALVRVYEATGHREYLDFAKWLVDARGRSTHYETEATFRKGSKYFDYDYYQAQAPVVEQTEVVGHAVRATYLYCGATDVARLTGDKALFAQMRRLFDDVISTKMYVTGSIGAHAVSERFSLPYDLPSDRAYAETCASIGLALWAERMLDVELMEEYAGTMERALYNTMMSGVSMDGQRYFYVNPLEVNPDVTDFRSDCEHVKTERVAWFGCACCPPNIARTLASFAKFVYTERADGVAINMYLSSELNDGKNTVSIEGDLYRGGRFTLRAKAGSTLYLRQPYWANGIYVDGEKLIAVNGYAKFVTSGEEHALFVDFVPRWIYPNPKVSDCSGKVALQYGPHVYCIEEADNGRNLSALRIDVTSKIRETGEYGGLPTLATRGTREFWGEGLYGYVAPRREGVEIKLIPYCLWNNRGRGEMRVWINI